MKTPPEAEAEARRRNSPALVVWRVLVPLRFDHVK